MLAAFEAQGLYFPDSINVSDPKAVMARLAAAASARGAQFMPASVTGLAAGAGGVRLTGPDLAIAAQKVVIAAGARSRPLAAQAGDRIPLDTERGYHLEFQTAAPLLNRPVCPVDLGFYMTPTVELGGLKAPPNPRRLALLDRGVRQFFPELGQPSSQWLGFRPSLPDSRPVIGRSTKSLDVIDTTKRPHRSRHRPTVFEYKAIGPQGHLATRAEL
ncbi:FAD-dependent oxidoreductase [Mesorhizobium abyssinicae]|uniref:NAD(P)/FAD-dependent oxidoreductase n=1 Tax=Mesorhizobium abyssinicae TaxID=1209958 RepID=UPI002A24C2CF|nr:FAD-dependent oxidoreductase [Mesorhizobium abyssinicae]MDX8433296.1 FAD-dependent oxidoreductase [Mesorhizobium abyssinicae]